MCTAIDIIKCLTLLLQILLVLVFRFSHVSFGWIHLITVTSDFIAMLTLLYAFQEW